MLITIRRLFALLLIPVFIVLFIGTLLTFRVNGTLLEAEFYTDTIRELDVFNFLYDEAIATAIEEAEAEVTFDLETDVPLRLDLDGQGIADNIKEVLPPEWLEENVAVVVNAAVPYITGEQDTFQINVSVDDRVEAASAVLKRLVLGADVHGYLLDDIVAPKIDENADTIQNDLPYGLKLTTVQVIDGIRTVVPEAWLKERIAEVIDEVTPYLTGESDTFAIKIPLQQRAQDGLTVVESWLLLSLDGGAYEYLLNDQIVPVVQVSLGSAVELPFGVTLTDEEIVAALADVLPAEWLGARVTEAIAEVGPYLTAETDSFTLVIDLEDRATAASEELVDLAEVKFQEVFDALPECTLAQLFGLELTLDETPVCVPGGMSYGEIKEFAGLDVLDQLVASVVDPLPKTIGINEEVLFDLLGDEVPYGPEDIRTLLRDGYTFDDQDLRKLIADQARSPEQAADNLQLLDDIRAYLRDGFSFDETQVEERLLDANVSVADFDDIRGYIGLGRDLLFVLVILLVVIAFIIGSLGGRHWGSRLLWAGVPVLIAGTFMAVALGPVAGIGFEFGDDAIRELDINPVFTDKLIELREELEQSFAAPMFLQSAIVEALGFLLMVFGIILGRQRQRVHLPEPGSTPWATPEGHQAEQVVRELRDDPDVSQTYESERFDQNDGGDQKPG